MIHKRNKMCVQLNIRFLFRILTENVQTHNIGHWICCSCDAMKDYSQKQQLKDHYSFWCSAQSFDHFKKLLQFVHIYIQPRCLLIPFKDDFTAQHELLLSFPLLSSELLDSTDSISKVTPACVDSKPRRSALSQKQQNTHSQICSAMEFTPGLYGPWENQLIITSGCHQIKSLTMAVSHTDPCFGHFLLKSLVLSQIFLNKLLLWLNIST